MKLSPEAIQQLAELERISDNLLGELAASPGNISRKDVEVLEGLAANAARLAFGSDNAALLSEQMVTLIAWTDHLDEREWNEEFVRALQLRPLRHPFR